MASETSVNGSSDENSRTSLTLLHRAAAADHESWQRLVTIYGPLVRHWARTAGVRVCDIDDVAQDVFQVLAGKLHEFDSEKGRGFRAWLWGISRNKLREFLRRGEAGAVAAGGTDAHIAMASVPAELDEETWTFIGASGAGQLLNAALNLVREDTQPHVWEAFWKMTIDGLPAADVGRELGMSSKAVRQAKYRVLQRLRLELGTDADDLLAS
jgi:RNA polymerase sigma-70 factor, ECF subfamily